MPLSFPSSPTTGQTSTQNGRTYSWTGYAWELVAASGGGSGEDALLRSLFVPPAPAGVSAVAGNAQAVVSWTAPTGVIAQAPITDYVVQFKQGSGSWETFTDGTSTATSVTVTGLTNGTAYTFKVAATNAVGTGSYSTASSAVTPVAGDELWSSVQLLLPGDTSVNDASSYNRSVSASGGAAVSTAQKRWGAGSIYFDGSGDWVATDTTSALTFGTADFTIEFWARPTGSQPSTPRIMGNLSANAFTTGDWVLTQNLGCSLYAFNYSSSTPIVSLGSSLTDDTWTHIAIVRSGNNWTMYKDGTAVSTNTWSGSLDSGTRRLVVGSSGSTAEAWNGYIDDLRVTKAARTITLPTAAFPTVGPGGLPSDGYFSSVSLLLHGDTSTNDFSSYSRSVTANGATVSTAQKRWGAGSIAFDGSGDYLTAAVPSFGTSDFVVEMWVYFTSISGAYTGLFDARPGVNGTQPALILNGSSIAFFTNGSFVISGGTIATGQWHHIALARSSGTTRLYLNGAQTGSSYTDANNYLSSASPVIGALVDGYGLTGFIDDLRITVGSDRSYTGATIQVPTAAFPDS